MRQRHNDNADHAAAPLRVRSLRVNGWNTPLGLDTSAPCFSWQIENDIRGVEIAAFRVIIATDPDRLDPETADVWDSGIVEANDHSILCPCEFHSCRRYWWQVRVQDTSGREAISAPAWFDTGLRAEDWHAEWIWRTSDRVVNDFAYFRKSFALTKPVACAKMFVSAHHVVQPFINGERMGGFGTPAPTNPWKRKFYTSYDITAYLREGDNWIAAVAHYLGGDGQNYVNGLPGFRMQLQIRYADGRTESIGTDETWMVMQDMPHRTGTPYQQNRRMSAIEDYDAAKVDPEWRIGGGDPNNWVHAVKAQIQPDEWPMQWQPIPEGFVDEVIVPTAVGRCVMTDETDGVAGIRQVFDAGKIVSGWPLIRLNGKAGITVRMRYSEDLDEHGYVKHNVCNERSEHYYDQYTMRGDDLETWQPDLSYKAFRYVEITGYPEPLIPGEHLWIVSAHTNLVPTGHFACSDPLLNDLYAACIQTQKNNTLGQTVDCPHREQAQYLADTDLQAETLLYNFDPVNILEKTLNDFADGQLGDGTFPFVYPSNYEHPDFSLQIPEWDLHYNTLMWKLYSFTGDRRILERNYDAAKRMVDYYAGTMDAQLGLVPTGKGWHISDWPYPSVDHSSEYLTVQNIKFYAAVRILTEAGERIGRAAEGRRYANLAEQLADSIRRHLYDSELRRYRDCLGSDKHHQGVNALALFYGLVPESDRSETLRYIAEKEWESKTVLSLPLLRVLFENGYEEAAYRLMNRGEYPGWGYMIRQGSRTMWEGWDDIESHCHAWNGYPARMLQEYIAGIQPLSPGFRAVRIKPYMPADLSHAEAAVTTPRGPVRVRWERTSEDEPVLLQVHIPAGVHAELIMNLPSYLPDKTRIVETEGVVWNRGISGAAVPGIRSCGREAGGWKIAVASGSYEFKFELMR